MNCTDLNHTLFLAVKKELEDYLGYFGVSNNFIILIFLVILVMSCITNITLVADQGEFRNVQRPPTRLGGDVEAPPATTNRYDLPPAYQTVVRRYEQNNATTEAPRTAANTRE